MVVARRLARRGGRARYATVILTYGHTERASASVNTAAGLIYTRESRFRQWKARSDRRGRCTLQRVVCQNSDNQRFLFHSTDRRSPLPPLFAGFAEWSCKWAKRAIAELIGEEIMLAWIFAELKSFAMADFRSDFGRLNFAKRIRFWTRGNCFFFLQWKLI